VFRSSVSLYFLTHFYNTLTNMPGGRPKKFPTTRAADAGKKESDRQRYQRRRLYAHRAEFIAYEPSLPQDLPTETPVATGLRISPDIPLPQDTTSLQSDHRRDEHQPSTPILPVHLDAELLASINQAQADEQESIQEQDLYESVLVQQMEQSAIATARDRIATPAEPVKRESVADAQDHLSETAFALAGSPFPTTPDATIALARTPSVFRQQEPASSSRASSQRKKSFPPQTNTLRSWIISTPAHSPASSVTAPQASPSRNSALPTHSSTHLQDQHANPASSSSPPLTAPSARSVTESPHERTASKLAKQLQKFQGCTSEEHQEATMQHRRHHERPVVHSACSSITEITQLLRGDYEGGTRLPDVLSDPKLMKPADLPVGLDCRSAFEGIRPASYTSTPDESLPRNLCLLQHHACSLKNRAPTVTFDIDSLCCFPSSLGIARQGLH
jgi:hypothetical protein